MAYYDIMKLATTNSLSHKYDATQQAKHVTRNSWLIVSVPT